MSDLFEKHEGRDAAEILPERLPDPIQYVTHRDFVREVLGEEVEFSAVGEDFVDREEESKATLKYREQLNRDVSPSDAVAADYVWHPGTELNTIKPGAIDLPRSFEREQIRRTV